MVDTLRAVDSFALDNTRLVSSLVLVIIIPPFIVH